MDQENTVVDWLIISGLITSAIALLVALKNGFQAIDDHYARAKSYLKRLKKAQANSEAKEFQRTTEREARVLGNSMSTILHRLHHEDITDDPDGIASDGPDHKSNSKKTSRFFLSLAAAFLAGAQKVKASTGITAATTSIAKAACVASSLIVFSGLLMLMFQITPLIGFDSTKTNSGAAQEAPGLTSEGNDVEPEAPLGETELATGDGAISEHTENDELEEIALLRAQLLCREFAGRPDMDRLRTHLRVAQDFASIAILTEDLWANRDLIRATITGITNDDWERLKVVLESIAINFVENWAIDYLENKLTDTQRQQFRLLLATYDCGGNLSQCVINWLWDTAVEAVESYFSLKIRNVEDAINILSRASSDLDAAIDDDDVEALVRVSNETVFALERILVLVQLSDYFFNVRFLPGREESLRGKLNEVSKGQFDVRFYTQHHAAVIRLSDEIEADINILARLESVCDHDSLCGASSPPEGVAAVDWIEHQCVSRKARVADSESCHRAIHYMTLAQRDAGQGCPGSWVECCSREYIESPKQWVIDVP